MPHGCRARKDRYFQRQTLLLARCGRTLLRKPVDPVFGGQNDEAAVYRIAHRRFRASGSHMAIASQKPFGSGLISSRFQVFPASVV